MDPLSLDHRIKKIGSISAQFQRQEVSSSESEEEEDLSPWLSLWLPYNSWHSTQVEGPGPGQPLHLYIDAVHLLPQHILLAKVQPAPPCLLHYPPGSLPGGRPAPGGLASVEESGQEPRL